MKGREYSGGFLTMALQRLAGLAVIILFLKHYLILKSNTLKHLKLISL